MRPYFSRKVWLLVGIALLTTTAPLRAGESDRGRELRHRLSTIVDYPGIEDVRAKLSEVLEQLSKRYNLTFDINQEAFKNAGFKEIGILEIANSTPIPPMRTKLAMILRKILRRVPHPATYLIRGGAIEITTTEAVRKEFSLKFPLVW